MRECGGQSISDDFAAINTISTVHTICSKGLLVSKHSRWHFDENEGKRPSTDSSMEIPKQAWAANAMSLKGYLVYRL